MNEFITNAARLHSFFCLLSRMILILLIYMHCPFYPSPLLPKPPTTVIIRHPIKFAGIHSTPTKYGPTSSPIRAEIDQEELSEAGVGGSVTGPLPLTTSSARDRPAWEEE
jgi:hypothetical protein